MRQQLTTYQARQDIRRIINPVRLGRHHFAFLSDFFRRSRAQVLMLVSLLFIQAMMEVTALIFISGSVREQAFNAFHRGDLAAIIVMLAAGLAVYLAVSFLTLRIERQTVLAFINKLRRTWFLLILRRSESVMTNDRKADFVAKASYHFPLVSLGIDNSALGTMRWALCACILMIVASTGETSLLLGSFAIVIMSLLLGVAAYFLARHYVSREVASYSKVIRHIDSSLAEFSFIKVFAQEYASLKGLDARVDVDTYFRVRRDIWLRYFNKVVHVLFFIATLAVLIVNIRHPEIFLRLCVDDQDFRIGIVAIYALRLFYESGRSGLYVPPLILGLSLSIPEQMPRDISGMKKERKWSVLEFRSNKTKLHVEGKYFKNMALRFERGRRYLFVGEPYRGKTSLAELLAGKARFNRKGWLVKMDEQRFDYLAWVNLSSGAFFLSPYFRSDKTVGEVVFGKEKHAITAEDLFLVHVLSEKHPFLSMAVSKKRFMGESLRSFETSSAFLFAVYVLHCLACRPGFIVIDNQWLDLKYSEINSMITHLHTELPDSVIAAFSRHNNDAIPYDEKYEIKTDVLEAL